MKAIRLLFATCGLAAASLGVYSLAAASPDVQTPIESIDAQRLVFSNGTLYAAETGGGIEAYDASNGSWERTYPTTRPVQTMRVINGRLCWVELNSRTLHLADADGDHTEAIDVSGLLLGGPIYRICGWKNKIVVQGDSSLAIVDPEARTACGAEEVLPPDVYTAASQGVVDSYCLDGQGIFVVARRYDRKQKPDPADGISEVGLISAWNFTADDVHFLGAYAGSLVNFHDVPGAPIISYPEPNGGVRRLCYGTADMGNLCVKAEGAVGLSSGRAVAIPFPQQNWTPNLVRTAFRPEFAQSADFAGSSVWWTDRHHAYRADLSDGTTEAYVAKSEALEIRSVVCDATGAWVATSSGLKRIYRAGSNPEWVKITASAKATATTHEQFRLLDLTRNLDAGGTVTGGEAKITDLLRAAGAQIHDDLSGLATTAANGSNGTAKQVAVAELGDVVVDHDAVGVYLGAGRVLSGALGSVGLSDLKANKDTVFYRVLPRSPVTADDVIPAAPTQSPRSSRVSYPVEFTQSSRSSTRHRTYRSFDPYVGQRTSRRSSDITPLPEPLPDAGQTSFPHINSEPTGRTSSARDTDGETVSRPTPDLRPVGLSHPNENGFVYAEPGADFDQPHLPSQFRLKEVVESWVGTPYVYGAESRDGTDCSGFVRAVFRELHVPLPRNSQSIGRVPYGKRIDKGPLHFGDVLVFTNPHQHVAIYMGNGRTVEAIRPCVTFSYLSRHPEAVVKRFLF